MGGNNRKTTSTDFLHIEFSWCGVISMIIFYHFTSFNGNVFTQLKMYITPFNMIFNGVSITYEPLVILGQFSNFVQYSFLFSFGPASKVPKLTHYGVV